MSLRELTFDELLWVSGGENDTSWGDYASCYGGLASAGASLAQGGYAGAIGALGALAAAAPGCVNVLGNLTTQDPNFVSPQVDMDVATMNRGMMTSDPVAGVNTDAADPNPPDDSDDGSNSGGVA